MWTGLRLGQYWLYGLMLLPAAGLLARLFMIQHDCGHSSFFHSRRANDWIGRILGVVTLTPYDAWRSTHAEHHASSGNLDRRGIGDVHTLTVDEYRALSGLRRLGYRLYRHPLVMFGIGPIFLFFIWNRVPDKLMKTGIRAWVSPTATNVAIGALSAIAVWALGMGPFLLLYGPVTVLAACAAVWLFYVQHQFEATHWERAQRWNAQEAALLGSSNYDLPPILRWFSGNIGFHHVHHLVSRIPFYRLPEVIRDFPELRSLNRLSLVQSLASVRLALWDETNERLVSFEEPSARTLPGRDSSMALPNAR